jgi:WD40 repeat protein
VWVWNLKTGECTRVLQGHADRVSSVAVSPDGQFAVSGSWDKTVRVWNLQTYEGFLTIQADGPIHSVCIGLSRIIAGDIGGNVLLFSPQNIPPGIPVVTAWKNNGEFSIRCLYCGRFFVPDYGDFGQEISCPICGGVVKLNPFTVKSEELVFGKNYHN